MTSKNSKKFFQRDGKPLNNTIETISIVPTSEIHINQAIFDELNSPPKPNNLRNLLSEKFEKFVDSKPKLPLPNIKSFSLLKLSSFSAASLAIAIIVLLVIPLKIKPRIDAYSIYSSKPLTMDEMTYDIYTKDSRSQRINEVFKEYGCPLEGMGETFVHEADENDIPWWIVAAIAFQESSCGKNSPKIDGQESYNAWGWAVYGESVHSFDNWARGIETVSKYLSNRFYSQGITNTCEIMKIYTPPSNGSWCEGVEHFKELIVNYKSPAAE
ncbi:hypothetical protein JXA34_02735 [Patescibacteria group bacterium]|nr:hypothetical protein [Patescibacteria group bacterium]